MSRDSNAIKLLGLLGGANFAGCLEKKLRDPMGRFVLELPARPRTDCRAPGAGGRSQKQLPALLKTSR